MDQEKIALEHELKNVEQQKLALQKAAVKAADEIDELAEADWSAEAIAKAKRQADRLRKIGGIARSSE